MYDANRLTPQSNVQEQPFAYHSNQEQRIRYLLIVRTSLNQCSARRGYEEGIDKFSREDYIRVPRYSIA
jgi:hypothetical protein